MVSGEGRDSSIVSDPDHCLLIYSTISITPYSDDDKSLQCLVIFVCITTTASITTTTMTAATAAIHY